MIKNRIAVITSMPQSTIVAFEAISLSGRATLQADVIWISMT